eukprot:6021533-Pyramimonas_sp.AAC.1
MVEADSCHINYVLDWLRSVFKGGQRALDIWRPLGGLPTRGKPASPPKARLFTDVARCRGLGKAR